MVIPVKITFIFRVFKKYFGRRRKPAGRSGGKKIGGVERDYIPPK
jgi:hypothetical protein